MPESRHLTMDYELPGMDIVPEVKILRFSEKLHKTALSPRARRRCIQLNGSVIAQIALRTIHEIYQADRTDKVDLIRFKGYVKVTDLITNYDMPLPVARIDITRRQFLDIDLRSVDPVECLKGLDKAFSPALERLAVLSLI